jgi:hypothetical protein
MNRPTSFRQHDDGIIKGWVSDKMGHCPVCNTDRRVILIIHTIDLPTIGKRGRRIKMKPDARLILFRSGPQNRPVRHDCIGITCGCYAKAHRQLARIDQRNKER